MISTTANKTSTSCTDLSQGEDHSHYRWPSVAIPRAILITLVLTAVVSPSLWNPFLSSLWEFLSHSKFYNSSTFETVWTVIFYALLETVYNVKLLRNPELRLHVLSNKVRSQSLTAVEPPQLRVPWKRFGEILIYIAPLLAMDLTMIKKLAGVPLADIQKSGGWDSITRDGQISASFLAPKFHNFSRSSPLQLVRALPPSHPTSRRVLTELITSILIYDTLFFLFHLSLHRISFLRRIHMSHHNHGEINPQITNQLDIGERLGLVLLANFSLNIIGSHVLTRTLFIPIFVYLLIEIHSGLDLPWGYEKILPWGIGAGSRKHAIHHRTGTRFYEPFFCWWDKLLRLLEGECIVGK